MAHPQVRLHFTPTYSSWLNQVELWFAKIERDLLARGMFTSVPDLARKFRRYITRYNDDPKPIRWTYSNPAHRITTDSAVTVHYAARAHSFEAHGPRMNLRLSPKAPYNRKTGVRHVTQRGRQATEGARQLRVPLCGPHAPCLSLIPVRP